jgi:hypothetical protein
MHIFVYYMNKIYTEYDSIFALTPTCFGNQADDGIVLPKQVAVKMNILL